MLTTFINISAQASTGSLMLHPGMPLYLANIGISILLGGLLWYARPLMSLQPSASQLANPLAAQRTRISGLLRNPAVLGVTRVIVAGIFLLLIYAGLFGTQIPEKNAATIITWTLWWTLVVMSVFVVGSFWCAVCPWDTLASFLAKRKLWRRQRAPYSLELKTPPRLRNVTIAAILFAGLSWLELGYGVTLSPYTTAVLALIMVVLATASMVVFERKAFCQYFCPVGRTLGLYSQLSIAAIRPVNSDVCAKCTTLECYHGTDEIDPCPTHLVMGTLKNNTYCISCANCIASCPHDNVAWASKHPGYESVFARISSSESFFLLMLLSLALFHGITMMPAWDPWVKALTFHLSAWGLQTTANLMAFSMIMLVCIVIPMVIFAMLCGLSWSLAGKPKQFKPWLLQLSFIALPVAFAYHVAHNLSHLLRESQGLTEVLLNPVGLDALPLSQKEIHLRHLNAIINPEWIFAFQVVIIILGYLLAARIARKRINSLCAGSSIVSSRVLIPVMGFVFIMSGFSLWLLMQPMAMRY